MGDEKIILDLTGKVVVDLKEYQQLTSLKDVLYKSNPPEYVVVIEISRECVHSYRYESPLDIHQEIIKEHDALLKKMQDIELEYNVEKIYSEVNKYERKCITVEYENKKLEKQIKRLERKIISLKEENASLKSKLNFVNLCLPFLKIK